MNLMCEADTCCKTAEYFGIQGKKKKKVCSEHTSIIAQDGMTICNIEGFYFTNLPEDISEYKQGKQTLCNASLNIGLLESKYKYEINDILSKLAQDEGQIIGTVNKCFSGIREEINDHYWKILGSLSGLKKELAEFTWQNESTFPGDIVTLSQIPPSKPSFISLSVYDIRSEVEALILSHMKCRYKSMNEALVECAQELEIEHIEIKENLLLERANAAFSTGMKKKEAREFNESVKSFKEALRILKTHPNACKLLAAVATEASEVLTLQLGLYAKAERMLQRNSAAVVKNNPWSEEAVQAQNSLAAVYYHSGQAEKALRVTSETLRICIDADTRSACYWEALFYAVESAESMEQIVSIKKMNEREMSNEDIRSRLLRLIVMGRISWSQGAREEAEDWFNQAEAVADQEQKRSVFSALVYSFLGNTKSYSPPPGDAINSYCQAKNIFVIAAPKSIWAADNLSKLGRAYEEAKKLAKADESYYLAKTIFDVVAPQSVRSANNCFSMGLLHETLRKTEESVALLEEAQQIYHLANCETMNRIAMEDKIRVKESRDCRIL